MREGTASEAALARSRAGVALWAVAAAFGTYFCMYAFRKPFTAASYGDVTVWGLGYKSVIVSAQVIGYTLSKFLGIRIVAELTPERRAGALLGLIGVAELALVGFALVPQPYNWPFLFLNGLPLGLVFGLVLGFLEGRRVTEALTAGLCASFIFADGVTKTVGAWLLTQGVPVPWMPSVAGLMFGPPLVLFVWMLTRVPRPDGADVEERAERAPLSRREQWQLVVRCGGVIVPVVVLYTLTTVVRSLRADFAPEIWLDLGQAPDSSVFARSETLVAIGVLAVNAVAALVRDNRAAFRFSLVVSACGMVVMGAALAGLQFRSLGGFAFMVLTGFGLYLPYVAVQTTVFERLIAMTRARGNLGFLIYIADAFGYLGYVVVMIVRAVITTGSHFLGWFQGLAAMVAVLGLLCLAVIWRSSGETGGR